MLIVKAMTMPYPVDTVVRLFDDLDVKVLYHRDRAGFKTTADHFYAERWYRHLQKYVGDICQIKYRERHADS